MNEELPTFKTLDWSLLLDFPAIIAFDRDLSSKEKTIIGNLAEEFGIKISHGVHAPIVAFQSGEDRTLFIMNMKTTR